MEIKQSILELIRHNDTCKWELIKYFDYIHYRTFERWLSDPKKQRRFTEAGAVKIICEYLGMKENEIFETK